MGDPAGDGEQKKKVWIDEGVVLEKAMNTWESDVGGVWLGGKRYNIINALKMDVNNVDRIRVFAADGKKGIVVAQTEWCFCIGHYDEEKNIDGRNCQTAVLDLAKSMSEQDY